MRDRLMIWGSIAVAGVVFWFTLGDQVTERIGWPPFANARDVAAIVEDIREDYEVLRGEMMAASERALWLELQNAFASGDRQRIIRACQALQNATGRKPAGCP